MTEIAGYSVAACIVVAFAVAYPPVNAAKNSSVAWNRVAAYVVAFPALMGHHAEVLEILGAASAVAALADASKGLQKEKNAMEGARMDSPHSAFH